MGWEFKEKKKKRKSQILAPWAGIPTPNPAGEFHKVVFSMEKFQLRVGKGPRSCKPPGNPSHGEGIPIEDGISTRAVIHLFLSKFQEIQGLQVLSHPRNFGICPKLFLSREKMLPNTPHSHWSHSCCAGSIRRSVEDPKTSKSKGKKFQILIVGEAPAPSCEERQDTSKRSLRREKGNLLVLWGEGENSQLLERSSK